MQPTKKDYFAVQLAAITGLSMRSNLNTWEIPRLAKQIADAWLESERHQSKDKSLK